jgi:hypothetical protein
MPDLPPTLKLIRRFSLVIVTLITFLLCLLSIRNGHNWGDDFALYISQARAIVNDNITEVTNANIFMVENSTYHLFSPHVYPWGYPIILGTLIACGFDSFLAFKVSNIVFLLIFLIYYYKICCKYLPFYYGLFATAILGFNHLIICFTADNVLSEIPYLCVSTVSLYLILSFRSLKGIRDIFYLVLTSILIFFSFIIRTEGAAIILCLMTELACFTFSICILRKKIGDGRLSMALMLVVLFFSFYLLQKLLLPADYNTHFHVFLNSTLSHIRLNSIRYCRSLDALWMVHYPVIFFICSLLIVLWGVLKHVLKGNYILSVYFISIVVISLIWPFFELRYALNKFPFYLFFFLLGVKELKLPRLAVLSFMSLSLFFIGYNLFNNIDFRGNTSFAAGPESKDATELFKKVKELTNQTDVIAFFKPRALYLYTHRRSLIINTKLIDLKKNCTYYIYNKSIGRVNQIDLQNDVNSTTVSENLVNVFENSTFQLYKIIK